MKTRQGKRGCYHLLLCAAAAVSPEPSCPQDGRAGRRACQGKGMLLTAATWHQCNEWELNASNADSQLNCLLLPFSPSQEGSRLFLNLGPRYVTIPNAFSHVKEDGK